MIQIKFKTFHSLEVIFTIGNSPNFISRIFFNTKSLIHYLKDFDRLIIAEIRIFYVFYSNAKDHHNSMNKGRVMGQCDKFTNGIYNSIDKAKIEG